MSAPRKDEQHAGTVATENPGDNDPGQRHEVGDSASSRRDPPHVTDNDQEATSAGKRGAEGPSLPANASGRDEISSEEQDFDIDEESAYDRRPTQDKDRPARSENAGG